MTISIYYTTAAVALAIFTTATFLNTQAPGRPVTGQFQIFTPEVSIRDVRDILTSVSFISITFEDHHEIDEKKFNREYWGGMIKMISSGIMEQVYEILDLLQRDMSVVGVYTNRDSVFYIQISSNVTSDKYEYYTCHFRMRNGSDVKDLKWMGVPD